MGVVHHRPRWQAGEDDGSERRSRAPSVRWTLVIRDRSAVWRRGRCQAVSTAASAARIGWIGIGRMGYAMAERLAKARADLTVWNRTRSKAEPLAEHGAKIAVALPELAACDIVFCMVSTWDDVKEVVAGAGGLLSDKTRAPKLLIECSSISLEGSAELRRLLQARGVQMLAAPVSGNAKVIKAGRLSFVCSGPKSAFDS
ncbi:MAG: NAD(P)-dependent oxidoreductase, partial [Betaproteobacteria bacterium]